MTVLFIVMALALGAGMPIGFALLLAGISGITWMELDLRVVPMRVFAGMDSFLLLAVPTFLFAGEVMMRAGVTARLLRLMNLIVGRFKGGTAYSNVFANMLMAGISGSAAADAAAIGRILIPNMIREGYSREYAASITAAASIVGPIIPPSVLFIVAGNVSNVSVLDLFIAGIVPGVLIIVAQALMVAWHVRKLDLPRPQQTAIMASKLAMMVDIVIVAFIPLCVLLGLRFGIFTPTEAGGIVALIALLIGFLITREMTFAGLMESAIAAFRTSASVYLIIAGASCCAYLMVVSGLGNDVSAMVRDYGLSKGTVLTASIIIYFILGLVLEPTAILILTLPIFLPIISGFGYDRVAFVTIATVMTCIGLITPPVGVCLAITAKIGETTMMRCVGILTPYLAASMVVVAIITIWPVLITYLIR